MEIQESCTNWKMNFECPNLPDLADTEKQRIKEMLHIAGDCIGVASQFNDDLLIRNQTLTSLYWIMLQTKAEVMALIENVMNLKAWSMKMDGKFSDENLYGLNIKNALIGLLATNEMEKDLVEGSFPDEDYNPFFDEEDESEGDLNDGIK